MNKPLRIAVLVYEFPALSETFVLNQVTGLIDRGHDVTILADRPRDEDQTHEDIERYRLKDRTIYGAPPNALPHRALGSVSRASAMLAHGQKAMLLRSLDIRRFGRSAASGRLLFWTAQLAEERPFDVTLAHFGPMGDLAVRLRQAGVRTGPIATIMHGVDVSAQIDNEPLAYKTLFSEGDLFLPISQAWRTKLHALGCPEEKTTVHHMGVDTDRYPFVERRPKPEVPVRLLTLGRLVEKKGVADALHAISLLHHKGVSLTLDIVGDGPDRSAMETLRDGLGLQNVVRFHGWRRQDEIADLMRSHDLLLAPSVTASNGDQEGIPVTLMEAMASGMPVVSTRHSGIPELVEDGRSGLLVEERDPQALSAAIERLLAMPESWPAISRNARHRIEQGFDVGRLNARLEKMLEGLVRLDAPRPPGSGDDTRREPVAPAKSA